MLPRVLEDGAAQREPLVWRGNRVEGRRRRAHRDEPKTSLVVYFLPSASSPSHTCRSGKENMGCRVTALRGTPVRRRRISG